MDKLSKKVLDKLNKMDYSQRKNFLEQKGFKETLNTKIDRKLGIHPLTSQTFKKGKQKVYGSYAGKVGYKIGKKRVRKKPFLTAKEQIKLILSKN